MNEPDDTDLGAAFADLRAPASTANYSTRTTGLDVSTAGPRWPQALASALAVLIAVGGAGTFLALRSARQGGSPAGTAANPPPRSGAAMAYDSTAGLTVMFGGAGRTGAPLTDTWTWNGSAWHAAASGPGRLVDVRMVDDPAENGVLLVGLPFVDGNASSGSGCVVGTGTGTGVVVPGNAPAAGTPGSVPAHPALTLPPADVVPTPAAAPSGSASVSTSCPSVSPAPAEQTWLFSGEGWTRAARSSSASAPPAGAQLTVDPTTHQVIAVDSSFVVCAPPLEQPAGAPAIACPVMESGSAGFGGGTGTVPGTTPCAVPTCRPSGAISTWVWTGSSWKQSPAAATLHVNATTLLFNDPATGHATLMAQDLGSLGCPASFCATPSNPTVTTWTWTGSAWHEASRVPNIQSAPVFVGAAIASVNGHLVLVTTAGETWTWAAGQWTLDSVAIHPSARFESAMAAGPGGTVVLFGGTVAPGAGFTASSGFLGLGAFDGSDTWVWDGTGWRHVAGTAPVPPRNSGCASVKGGPVPPCAPLPAQEPPSTGTPNPTTAPLPAASSAGAPTPS